MNGKLLRIIAAAAVLFLLTAVRTAASTAPRDGYGTPVAVYHASEVLSIVSYSEKWKTTEQLDALYRELLANVHGEELSFLSAVYLYPDSPDGAAGYYAHDYTRLADGSLSYKPGRYIELFNCDSKKMVADIASVLSQEYGHHVTFYYMIEKEGLERKDWVTSRYVAVRGLSHYEQLCTVDDPSKLYLYEWDVAELMANDYIQLYGSPLARQTNDYLDVQERVNSSLAGSYTYQYNIFNARPQRNMALPLAADIPELQGYFKELTGMNPAGEIHQLTIKAPYLDSIYMVYDGYNQYRFRWQAAEPKGSYNYTFLLNPIINDDTPIPVRTVMTGETLIARAGSAVNKTTNRAILANLLGQYQARVLVLDDGGYLHSSPIADIKITTRMNAPIKFSDVPESHWAADYIYNMTLKGYVNGYGGGLFKPENTLTRAEFMAFLLRTETARQRVPRTVKTGYWFVDEGYLDMASGLDLVSALSAKSYLDRPITRLEMTVMVYKMLELYNLKGSDIYKAPYTDIGLIVNKTALHVVSYYGIITGYKDNTFRPFDYATRAETMTILSRYLSVI